MSTRVIRIDDFGTTRSHRGRGFLDPAGTALMLSISGSVLAASVLIAALSPAAGQAQGLLSGGHPSPAPPPALVTPAAGAAPVAP